MLSIQVRCGCHGDEELGAKVPRSVVSDDRAGESIRTHLGSICVWASIRHGQKHRLVMFERESLILKFLSIDRFAASPVTSREIASLDHEATVPTLHSAHVVRKYKFRHSLLDDPMERRSLIVQLLATLRRVAFFTRTQSPEVFSCFRNQVTVQGEHCQRKSQLFAGATWHCHAPTRPMDRPPWVMSKYVLGRADISQ